MEKKEPTREEQKRALMRVKDRCARIEKLLASVAKIGTQVSPYLHDVGAIKRKATQELSHIKLAELDDQLAMLLSELKSVPAADGEVIISPRRYELFFSSRGS